MKGKYLKTLKNNPLAKVIKAANLSLEDSNQDILARRICMLGMTLLLAIAIAAIV